MKYFVCLLAMLVVGPVLAQINEKIGQTEVFIAKFVQFVAATGYNTKAEQTGGIVYGSGCMT